MKKTSLILAVLLVLSFSVFALASGDSSGETADQGSTAASSESSVDNTAIGNYSVVIDSCRLAKGYDSDVIIVKYIFTNVSSDEPVSFTFAFDATAYQNGVSLNEEWFVDEGADYDSGNQSKEIKKGASLEVEVAYELNDTVTDVEVEIKELFSFSDKTITKTFSISE